MTVAGAPGSEPVPRQEPAPGQETGMAENLNIEVAHTLSEPMETERPHWRWRSLIETAEVALLAIVAIATAWSGYQVARWDGHQALFYGEATRERFAADDAATHGGQLLLSDLTLFSGWLQSRSSGDAQLQAIYVRRFSPEYRAAFMAWLTTDPFNDPQAPGGPSAMPEYHNPPAEEARRLNDQAGITFDHGTAARETAERYVRDTVLFATVLFLVAIAQRFQSNVARVWANAGAGVLLVYVLTSAVRLPRL